MIPLDAAPAAVPPPVYRAPRRRQHAPTQEWRRTGWASTGVPTAVSAEAPWSIGTSGACARR
eukprot:2109893-Pyramimonas_sp.AAC.1